MSEAIQCPSCQAKLAVGKEMQGKLIRCPKCTNVVRVSGGSAKANGERSASIAVEKKSSSAAPSLAERPRRRRNDEPKGKNARLWILVGAASGCGVLVLLVGLVAAILVVGGFKASSPPRATVKQAVPTSAVPLAPAAQPVAVPGTAKTPPAVVPPQMDAAVIRQVKEATVFLRVALPNGDIAEGSGFFCMAPGIVVTNAHVLGMLRSDATPPSRVDAVVRSGEAGEKKTTASVLGVDRGNDLAVLRIDDAALPPPLNVDSAEALHETQKVYIFGFPLGAELGKNITVSESSVSSLRRDDGGRMSRVQVNGGMTHGNSGGPVTDARGVVVGVCVSGYEGTQVDFAIPGDVVRQVFDGRCDRREWGTAYRGGDGQPLLPVKLTCLDPLKRIREVKIDIWTGAAAQTRPASKQQPPTLPGDSRHATYGTHSRGAEHTADVPLPKTQAGQVCWLQPVLVTDNGQEIWDKAVIVPSTVQVVLERKAALLQFKPAVAVSERTLQSRNAVAVTVYKGKRKIALHLRMDGQLLESLSPDPRGIGTFIRLTLGKCSYTREGADQKKTSPPPQANALLTQYSPTFLVNANNACKERGKRNFTILPQKYRDSVENMYENVCNTYESTTLPLPNRTVQPLESWPARMPMFILANGKRSLQDIFVTCVYEGIRIEDGREEAYLALSGMVKGRGKLANVVLGKARGIAHFDVEKGFLTLVQLTVRTELESEQSGARILVEDTSVIRRADGNHLGIKAAVSNQPRVLSAPRTRRPRRR